MRRRRLWAAATGAHRGRRPDTSRRRRLGPAGHVGHAAGAEAAIFYYPWYSTPTRDGHWAHWYVHGEDGQPVLSTPYYPTRGLYSSSNVKIVGAQMREIAATGIRTVIVSWWGFGSPEDLRLPLVANAASRYGLSVAIHIEPYRDRTPATTAEDIEQLRDKGFTDFYVYDADRDPASAWAEALARARRSTCHRSHAPRRSRPGGRLRRSLHLRRRDVEREHVRPNLLAGTSCRPCCARRPSAPDTTPGSRPETSSSGRGFAGDLRPHVEGGRASSSRHRDGDELQRVAGGHADRARTHPGRATGLRRGVGETGTVGPARVSRGNHALGCAIPQVDRSVESRRELASVGDGDRVVLTEMVEDRDRELTQAVSLLRRCGADRASRISSSARSWSSASSAARTSGWSPDARSSSSAPSMSGGASSRSTNARRRRTDSTDELGHDAPVTKPLDRRDALHTVLEASTRFASTSILTSSTAPSRLSISFSRIGASAWHGPHHSAQKSAITGFSFDRAITSCVECLLGYVGRHVGTDCSARLRDDDARVAAGDERGQDVVLGDAGERAVTASIRIYGHVARPRARAPDLRPEAKQLVGAEDAATAGLATCDALELSQLLERVDAHVRVRPDAQRDGSGGGCARRAGSRRPGPPRW